ncbi:MAG: rhomboid family intramembrane serine protease [Chitinophagaceae bacterium]|nr:MAG: rhomboid family intramembrane serine protease [Chitinophagaceae bacterium]
MANYGNSFQRTTPIVLNLIIINALAYFAQLAFGGTDYPSAVNDLFALHHYKSDVFKPYQVITHMFMHGGFTHLLFNMFGLWMFGSILERIWGPKRFLLFYLVCGVAAALVQMGYYAFSFHNIDQLVLDAENQAYYQEQLKMACTVGASGAIMGLLGAFGYLFPNTEMIVFPFPFPVKAKWLITVIALIDIFGGVYRTGSGIAHFAHIGGLLMGLILVIIWNKTNKRTFY